MGMIQLDLNPSHKKLRQFGLVALIMLTIIALLLGWRFNLPKGVVIGLCAAGAVLFIISRISTRLIWPVYAGLMVVSFPIGWVISHLVMGLFFFGVITPVGLVFRLLGRDALHRKWDPNADSYWVKYPRPDSVKRYFRQF